MIEEIKKFFEQVFCSHNWVEDEYWSDHEQVYYSEWFCIKCSKYSIETYGVKNE